MFSDFIIHMFYKFYMYKGLMLSLACIKKCSSIWGKISPLPLCKESSVKKEVKIGSNAIF